MKHILFIAWVAIGMIDSVDGNFASVEILNRGKYEYINVNLKDIPCTVGEGDEILFTEDGEGKRKIECIGYKDPEGC
tara:strand:- start:615 stop:845 length:231 start_codon:yes stop_codon:yes gene_type:complete